MRRHAKAVTLAIAAQLFLLSATPQAFPDTDQFQGSELQKRCGIDWLPAFTFANGSMFPDRKIDGLLNEIIRAARACRYRGLRIVVYPDDASASGRKLAVARSSTLVQMLVGPRWPEEAVKTVIRSSDDAPIGVQWDKSFRVEATIEFLDPDVNWKPSGPRFVSECKPVGDKSVCTQLPPATPQWVRDPWPPGAIHMPMVFFDAGSSQLDSEAQNVTDEAARRFLEANCRLLPVSAYTDTAEADPIGLSLRRALATRQRLVEDGVDPSAIMISALGNTELLVPTPAGVSEPQNRRASFDCVD